MFGGSHDISTKKTDEQRRINALIKLAKDQADIIWTTMSTLSTWNLDYYFHLQFAPYLHIWIAHSVLKFENLMATYINKQTNKHTFTVHTFNFWKLVFIISKLSCFRKWLATFQVSFSVKMKVESKEWKWMFWKFLPTGNSLHINIIVQNAHLFIFMFLLLAQYCYFPVSANVWATGQWTEEFFFYVNTSYFSKLWI